MTGLEANLASSVDVAISLRWLRQGRRATDYSKSGREPKFAGPREFCEALSWADECDQLSFHGER